MQVKIYKIFSANNRSFQLFIEPTLVILRKIQLMSWWAYETWRKSQKYSIAYKRYDICKSNLDRLIALNWVALPNKRIEIELLIILVHALYLYSAHCLTCHLNQIENWDTGQYHLCVHLTWSLLKRACIYRAFVTCRSSDLPTTNPPLTKVHASQNDRVKVNDLCQITIINV